MIVRHLPAAERFHTKIDWLDSWYSFSFGHHYDPARQGFRSLRVVKEDWIAPRARFPRHGHRGIEIMTYALEGALAHRD
jgi:redox-sensitive bicupin YhaK (pirin superfamily)